uniref:Uncharacterized protein n=1 Tax=Nelumbo nucifera TaxID=4432 RepID=A0A822Y371_NELNU|nr:TPA_asm: hypothetical protein HUJ06_025541 [Nelumbo nucifera]
MASLCICSWHPSHRLLVPILCIPLTAKPPKRYGTGECHGECWPALAVADFGADAVVVVDLVATLVVVPKVSPVSKTPTIASLAESDWGNNPCSSRGTLAYE